MNKTKQYTERFIWADIIRIFAIFSVVFVHNLFFLPANLTSSLVRWIPYLEMYIGVPLFVMISGAFLLGKEESNRSFFTKRVMRVLLPWIFWTCIYVFIDCAIYQKNLESLISIFHYFRLQFFSRFWFLPMIFGLYLLTPGIKVLLRSVKRVEIWYLLGLWAFAFSILPAIYKIVGSHIVSDTSLLRQVFSYSGYYILGYLLTRRTEFKKPIRFWFYLFLFAQVMTFAWLLLPISLQEGNTPFFLSLFSPNIILLTISVYMMFYTLFLKRQKIIDARIRAFLATISNAAFGIYLVHEIIMLVFLRTFPSVDRLLFDLSPFFAVPIRAVTVFIVSVFFVVILKRILVIKLFV